MMKKNNKTCIVCGKKYTFCNGCSEFDHLPRWMAIYHDANCKEIFSIAADFNAGDLTKEEAKERLQKCDLSNKKSFHEAILKAIDDINGDVIKNTKAQAVNVPSTEDKANEIETKVKSK